MYSHWIEVFHGADRYDVAEGIPHGLKLYLLPSGYASFNKDLSNRGHVKSALCDDFKFFGISRYSAAASAESKGRPDYYRIADLCRYRKGLLYGICYLRRDYRLSYRLHGLLEQLPVLRLIYGLHRRAEKPHVILIQDSGLFKLHGYGKACLASKACQEPVRLFLCYDTLHRFSI